MYLPNMHLPPSKPVVPPPFFSGSNAYSCISAFVVVLFRFFVSSSTYNLIEFVINKLIFVVKKNYSIVTEMKCIFPPLLVDVMHIPK